METAHNIMQEALNARYEQRAMEQENAVIKGANMALDRVRVHRLRKYVERINNHFNTIKQATGIMLTFNDVSTFAVKCNALEEKLMSWALSIAQGNEATAISVVRNLQKVLPNCADFVCATQTLKDLQMCATFSEAGVMLNEGKINKYCIQEGTGCAVKGLNIEPARTPILY